MPILGSGMHIVDSREDLPENRTHSDRPFDNRPLHLRTEVIPAGGIDFLSAAKLHEAKRLEIVAEMLALVGMMTCRGVFDKDALVSVCKALRQNGSGSRVEDTQAAHCIPGHILIDGIPINDYLEAPPGETGMHHSREEFLRRKGFIPHALCGRVRRLFEYTEVSASSLNQADSYVENESPVPGLKEIFGFAASFMVSPPLGSIRGKSWPDVVAALGYAYRFYRREALHKVMESESEKMRERGSLHFSASDVQRASLDMRVLVLRCFQTVLTSVDPPEVLTQPGFDQLRRSVMAGG